MWRIRYWCLLPTKLFINIDHKLELGSQFVKYLFNFLHLENDNLFLPFFFSHYLDMLFAHFVYYFENVSMCCSIYMTMALTYERFLAMKINRSNSIRNYSNCLQWVKMLFLCVFPVVLFSMLFNIPKIFEFEVVAFEEENDQNSLGYNRTVYSIQPSDLRLDYNYILGA